MRSDDATNTATYRFAAAVNNNDSKGAEVLAEISFHRYDVTSLSVRMDFLPGGEERVDAISRLRNLRRNHFWLFAQPPAEQSVEVLGVHGMSFQGGSGSYVNSAIVNATAIEIGVSTEFSHEDREMSVSVQLVPSGILVQPASLQHMGTGEVKRKVIVDGKVTVSTSLGELTATSWIDTSHEAEHSYDVTRLVERAVLSGKLHLKAGRSLSDLNEEFRHIAWDVCVLLGFAYRCAANYYQIAYHDPASTTMQESIVRRRIESVERLRGKGDREDLINFRNLINGGLDALYQALRNVPFRDDVKRSLSFLAACHASSHLAPAYFYAYAALETAVTAVDGNRAHTIGPSAWKRLRKRLESEIAMFLASEKMCEQEQSATADKIGRKLPELRRIAITDQIRQTCTTLQIATNDLWPTSIGFDAGLERATANRNLLVHSSRTDFPDQMNSDAVRLSTLTERILLRLLNWPDEKVWKWNDQPLRWINAEDEEVPAH